jgi:hypothetical protein
MFQVGEWVLELIICLLDVFKNEFNESIFQGVERQCELIFCILVIEKSDLDEIP